jgi:predicted ATPase
VTAKTHLLNLFYPERRVHKSWRGHFCCFQKPCPFVQLHWRE